MTREEPEQPDKQQIVMCWFRYDLSIAAMVYIGDAIEDIDLEAVLICHQLAYARCPEDPVIMMYDIQDAIKIKKARKIWKAEELAEKRIKRKAARAAVVQVPILANEMAGAAG